MVTYTMILYSAFNPSMCTHSSEQCWGERVTKVMHYSNGLLFAVTQ